MDTNLTSLTINGLPVIGGGGGIPATFGDVYYVDYRNGSDSHDGKHKDRAFKLLSRAYDAVTTNNNDLVLIDGDSEIVETGGLITLSKNRVHTIGLNGLLPPLGYGAGARVIQNVVTGAANTATFRNTGVRNTFAGIKFQNANSTSTCLHCVEEAGEYARYYNCEFYKSTLLTTNLTAEVLLNGDSACFQNCTFGDLVNSRGASGVERPNVKLDRETVAGKVCRDCSFIDCTFLHNAAHAEACFFYGHNANDVERRLVLVRPIFWNCALAADNPDNGINFGAAQTVGNVLLVNPASINVEVMAGGSLGVYVTGAVPTQNTSGKAVHITS